MAQTEDMLNKLIDFLPLAIIFACEPEQELLKDSETRSQLQKVLSQYPALFSKIESAALIKALDDADAGSLLVDYASLMIGPYQPPAQPYSSFYLDAGKLNTESTDWVSDYYELHGYHLDQATNELPDHFAAECDFILFMATKCFMAGKTNDISTGEEAFHALREFYCSHFMNWAPAFCLKVTTNAQEPFYQLTFGFLYKIVHYFRASVCDS